MRPTLRKFQEDDRVKIIRERFGSKQYGVDLFGQEGEVVEVFNSAADGHVVYLVFLDDPFESMSDQHVECRSTDLVSV